MDSVENERVDQTVGLGEAGTATVEDKDKTAGNGDVRGDSSCQGKGREYDLRAFGVLLEVLSLCAIHNQQAGG